MLIKTQLRLAALLPAVFALLIAAILWGVAQKVDDAQEQAKVAAQIRIANFELGILTQEYLLYGTSRSASQLLRRHQMMGDLLAGAEFDRTGEPDEIEGHELVATLRQSHKELGLSLIHI